VHYVDAANGGFGDKVQDILFVPPDELDKVDKTRKALVRRNDYLLHLSPLAYPPSQTYGSHAVEISARGHAFIPHLYVPPHLSQYNIASSLMQATVAQTRFICSLLTAPPVA
jgi:hypothetical protein